MAPPRACPCGTGQAYATCCGRWHAGPGGPPTAEALMRSRYSAFALGLADYLLASWHPSTRPASVATGDVRWTRLEVLSAQGGLFDAAGAVHFRAHHEGGVMEERSRFERVDGRWLYVDGT